MTDITATEPVRPGGLWLSFTRNRLSSVGLLLALIVFVAVSALWLAPYDPLEQNIVAEPLSAKFLLGTDSRS